MTTEPIYINVQDSQNVSVAVLKLNDLSTDTIMAVNLGLVDICTPMDGYPSFDVLTHKDIQRAINDEHTFTVKYCDSGTHEEYDREEITLSLTYIYSV